MVFSLVWVFISSLPFPQHLRCYLGTGKSGGGDGSGNPGGGGGSNGRVRQPASATNHASTYMAFFVRTSLSQGLPFP